MSLACLENPHAVPVLFGRCFFSDYNGLCSLLGADSYSHHNYLYLKKVKKVLPVSVQPTLARTRLVHPAGRETVGNIGFKGKSVYTTERFKGKSVYTTEPIRNKTKTNSKVVSC